MQDHARAEYAFSGTHPTSSAGLSVLEHTSRCGILEGNRIMLLRWGRIGGVGGCNVCLRRVNARVKFDARTRDVAGAAAALDSSGDCPNCSVKKVQTRHQNFDGCCVSRYTLQQPNATTILARTHDLMPKVTCHNSNRTCSCGPHDGEPTQVLAALLPDAGGASVVVQRSANAKVIGIQQQEEKKGKHSAFNVIS